jgi:hypothetical protein
LVSLKIEISNLRAQKSPKRKKVPNSPFCAHSSRAPSIKTRIVRLNKAGSSSSTELYYHDPRHQTSSYIPMVYGFPAYQAASNHPKHGVGDLLVKAKLIAKFTAWKLGSQGDSFRQDEDRFGYLHFSHCN